MTVKYANRSITCENGTCPIVDISQNDTSCTNDIKLKVIQVKIIHVEMIYVKMIHVIYSTRGRQNDTCQIWY